MKELQILTVAQKNALVEAVEHHIEVVNDEITEMCFDLGNNSGWEFDLAMENISASRKERDFMRTFLPALQAHPAGAGGVFLEAFEVGVLKSALASIVDRDEDDQSSIYDVISSENIKNTIRSTARSWGAIDPERLAIELARQAREALEGNNAAQDLLDQLK